MSELDNPTGIYHFNSDFNDASGFNRHLVHSGVTIDSTAPRLGTGCAHFDGIDDSAALPSYFDSLNAPFSLLAWINVDDPTSSFRQEIICGSQNDFAWGIQMTTGVLFFTRIGANYVESNTPISPGWHMVGLTYDGITARFYLDGLPDGNPAYADPGFVASRKAVGARPDTLTDWYAGLIDELVIYDSVISDIGMADYYNSGAGVELAPPLLTDKLEAIYNLNNNWNDSSPSGYNGTPTGGANFNSNDKVLGSHSGSFDGVNDYVTFGNVLDVGDNDLSISCWIKTTDASYSNIISKGKSGDYSWLININPATGGKLRFVLFQPDANTYLYPVSTTDINDGNWHHILCIFDQSAETAAIYIDGILEVLDNSPTGTFNKTSTANFRFGTMDDGSGPYGGLLDEVNIWSRALSDGGVAVGQTAGGEVAQLYNSGTGIELEITLYDGFVSQWRWNNSAKDELGNHDATITGAAFDDTIKKLGSHSLNCDGVDDYASIPDHPDLRNSEFSISGWIYVPFLGAEGYIWMKQLGSSPPYTGYTLELYTDNRFYFQAGDGVSWPAYQLTSAPVTSAGWYFFALTVSEKEIKIFVNDIEPLSISGGSIVHNTMDAWIGRNPDNQALYKPAHVDQLTFHTRVLSTAEVSRLYNNGIGTELSSAGLTDGLISLWHMNGDWSDSVGPNNGIPAGASFDTVKKLGSYSGQWDGIDDYVNCGNDSSLGFTNDSEFTISAWVYQTGDGPDGNGGTICGRYDAGKGYLFYHFTDSRGLFFQCDSVGFISNYQIPLSTWTHVIYRRDANDHKLYVNGVLRAGETKGVLSDGNTNFYVGTHSSALTQEWKGNIDELSIWGRALTDGDAVIGQTATGEIAELWNSGVGTELLVAALKADSREIKDLGFTKEMFSAVEELLDFDTYLQGILDENFNEVKERLSIDVYNDPARIDDIRRVEKYLAAAELWERRANLVLSMAHSDGPTGELEQARAEVYKVRAREIIDRLNPPS
ncbi:MAG: LamG domain-containing protein [Deltaproteobacteria bacterium]|nr:LamG domain-containing protein [Deltaproteobacteria bacterium]